MSDKEQTATTKPKKTTKPKGGSNGPKVVN